MEQNNPLKVNHWLPGPSPVSRSGYRSLAQNPEHQTDSLARSRKVVWSIHPLAAVFSGIDIRRIRPAHRSLKGTAALAEITE
jgi:hypothetical protein